MKRIMHKVGTTHEVKVYWSSLLHEYIARLYRRESGKLVHLDAADYYTTDQEDATTTAACMLQETEPQCPCSYCSPKDDSLTAGQALQVATYMLKTIAAGGSFSTWQYLEMMKAVEEARS